MPTKAVKSEKLDLRLPKAVKRQLQIAAQAESRSVSEYVLESAIARAQETLANRTRFNLSRTQWDAFIASLDASPRDLSKLKKLLREPGIFDGKPRA